jgi:hypothetical protein
MEPILQARETIVRFYKQFEAPVRFLAKLFIGVVIFSVLSNIGSNIGFHTAGFAEFFEPPLVVPIIILLGILYVILPPTLSYTIMIAVIGVQLSPNTELTILTVLFLLCILVFYIRLAPKESVLILCTIAAFYFRIPYVVPLLAGLYCSVTALIPIAIGVFIWNVIPVLNLFLKTSETAGLNPMELPNTFGALMPELFTEVLVNQEWIFTSFIFAMVVLAVYGISRINLDYSKEISIGLGAILTIVSFIIARILAEMKVNIAETVLFVILSALIAVTVRFFDIVMDYSRSERVEFEDEDNYYFVKVVPKVLMAKRARAKQSRVREEYED